MMARINSPLILYAIIICLQQFLHWPICCIVEDLEMIAVNTPLLVQGVTWGLDILRLSYDYFIHFSLGDVI